MIWIPVGISIILGIWCVVLIFRIYGLVFILQKYEETIGFYRRRNERLENELRLVKVPIQKATDYTRYCEDRRSESMTDILKEANDFAEKNKVKIELGFDFEGLFTITMSKDNLHVRKIFTRFGQTNMGVNDDFFKDHLKYLYKKFCDLEDNKECIQKNVPICLEQSFEVSD